MKNYYLPSLQLTQRSQLRLAATCLCIAEDSLENDCYLIISFWVIALAPLPVIDFIPLIVNQVGLVISIARIYKYKITKERAQELVGTFGIGMLGRTLFQQLSKLGSVPGWLLSSAIATSMTVVMGYAAIEWFEKGERITSERFNQLSKDLSKAFMERFKQVFKNAPAKIHA